MKRAGNVSLGDPFASIADTLATNFWMAQGSWAHENQVAIERFVESLQEAVAFIEQNPTQARQTPGLHGHARRGGQLGTAPTYNFDVRTGDLDKWVKVLKDIEQLDGNVQAEDLVLSSSAN